VRLPSGLTPALAAALCGAAVLTGCSGGDSGDSDDSGGTSTSATSTSSAEQSSSAPETGGGYTGEDGTDAPPPDTVNTDPDTADPSGGASTVTEIRIGRHEGFDRVVFELDGAGTPGWDVRYVDVPASQGSGEPIDVAGAAALQVTLTGIGLPDDTGVEEWAGPNPLSISETETVTEVAWDATFEGQSVAFVGTTAQAPFRVYPLEDPVRVVVEVVDPQ
jgi:hypothetical protein